MSDRRHRAGKFIVIVFCAWALAFGRPVSGQDGPAQEWHVFKNHHQELFDTNVLPDIQHRTEEFMGFWAQYLHHELIDGSEWQIRDVQHVANVKITRWEEHDWHGFENWRRMYDTYRFEILRQPRQYSDLELTRKMTKDLSSDRKVSLYFFGKSPTDNVVHVLYHPTLAPNQVKWEDFIHLTKDQSVYERKFTIPRSKAGEYSLTLELGEKPGIVKLTYICRPQYACERHDYEQCARGREGIKTKNC
jgi:hypothetical protein